jgi:peptide deformylase
VGETVGDFNTENTEGAENREERKEFKGETKEKTKMAIRTVLQLGNPGLRQVAKRVENPAAPEILALVEDLAETLAHWRNTTGYGRGIAAPQIGANLRVIFLRLPGEEPWPLVNPVITERSKEKIVVWDACLSFLSIFMQVERHREIIVAYQDLSGVEREIHAGEERNLSELLQHEIDHLNGILAVDRITDIRTMCTREEFEKRYRAGSPYAVEPAGKEA